MGEINPKATAEEEEHGEDAGHHPEPPPASLFELLQQFLFELLHNHSLPIHLRGGRITGVECALVGQNFDIESVIVTFCMCNVTFAVVKCDDD